MVRSKDVSGPVQGYQWHGPGTSVDRSRDVNGPAQGRQWPGPGTSVVRSWSGAISRSEVFSILSARIAKRLVEFVFIDAGSPGPQWSGEAVFATEKFQGPRLSDRGAESLFLLTVAWFQGHPWIGFC